MFWIGFFVAGFAKGTCVLLFNDERYRSTLSPDANMGLIVLGGFQLLLELFNFFYKIAWEDAVDEFGCSVSRLIGEHVKEQLIKGRMGLEIR